MIRYRQLSTLTRPYRVCVVGSGPAGFYTAYKLLKQQKNVQVDMLEALPVPYGLVRYGVAPDHPEVKAVQNKFDSVAEDDRFFFIGNVRVGDKLTVQDLRNRYHIVVLAYGAGRDRMLNIPGETSLNGVLGARDFVGWYNGAPQHKDLNPDLECTDTAVIVGQGNVALDVARVLLTPVDILAKTDMTECALETLRKSKIRRVHVVGRRGPVQVSFSAKELREMMVIPSAAFRVDRNLIDQHMERFQSVLEKDRVRKRLMKILTTPKQVDSEHAAKFWSLDFLRSPKEFIENRSRPGHLGAVKFEFNELEGSSAPKAVGTGKYETLETGLVLRSVGYRSIPVPGLPFDDRRGVVPNTQGRVLTQADKEDADIIPGLYVSGWLKTGPVGVIASTMYDAFQTAECIGADLASGAPMFSEDVPKRIPSREEVLQWLRTTQTSRPVTFADWKRVEAEEKRRGQTLGKPQEKFTSVEDMLKIIEQLDSRSK